MTASSSQPPLRRLAFAGTWYTGDPVRLAREVDELLKDAAPAHLTPTALIAPHAGLRYSGAIAACSYAALTHRALDTVVLIGPSHYMSFPGAAILREGKVETPWGALDIDASLAETLAGASPLLTEQRRQAHDREHSLELHLPFLARVQPSTPIVPILMGDQSRRMAMMLGDVLAGALRGRRAMIAASSDLSHYHDRAVAATLDAVVLDALGGFDPDGLMDALERNPEHACGGGPMVAAMQAARGLGASAGEVVRYADSGHVSADTSRVVGYVSAVCGVGP